MRPEGGPVRAGRLEVGRRQTEGAALPRGVEDELAVAPRHVVGRLVAGASSHDADHVVAGDEGGELLLVSRRRRRRASGSTM